MKTGDFKVTVDSVDYENIYFEDIMVKLRECNISTAILTCNNLQVVKKQKIYKC